MFVCCLVYLLCYLSLSLPIRLFLSISLCRSSVSRLSFLHICPSLFFSRCITLLSLSTICISISLATCLPFSLPLTLSVYLHISISLYGSPSFVNPSSTNLSLSLSLYLSLTFYFLRVLFHNRWRR